jgi:hypothetical protein
MNRWKASARDDMSLHQKKGHVLTGGVTIKYADNIYRQYF